MGLQLYRTYYPIKSNKGLENIKHLAVGKAEYKVLRILWRNKNAYGKALKVNIKQLKY